MKAFLLFMCALYGFAAVVSVNTKPGTPRKPHGSSRELMVLLALELGVAVWAFWLFWSLP